MAYYIKSFHTPNPLARISSTTTMYYNTNKQWSTNISDKKTFDTESAALAYLEAGFKDAGSISIVSE